MTGWCTLSGNPGWIWTLVTARTTSGWVLQAGPNLARDASGNYQWYIGWGRFDASGGWTCGTLATLSASTYPSLTGSIQVYYSGSNWRADITIYQNSQVYTHTFESGIGQYVSASNNDWTAAETDYQQQGVTLASNFQWQLTDPQFLVGGYWQNWNYHNSPSNLPEIYKLYMYVTFLPIKQGNTIGVQPLTTPGVKVYIGSSQANNALLSWCISGC